MRWIFFSLFAANLGIFIWWQTAKPQPQAAAHAYRIPDGVGSLLLLNEQASQQEAPGSAPAEAPVSAAPPPLLPETPAPPQPEAPAVSPEIPAANATPPAAEAPSAYTQCVLVGPYENNDTAQQALQKLHAKEIKAHLFPLEQMVPGGYQLYLDGFETRAQAKKRLDELQASGIDSFIVPKGEFINTIALGSYEQEAAAKGQQEKLMAAGIAVRVRESKRPVMELWLAMPEGVGDTLPEPLRQTLGIGPNEQKDAKKKEERQILCSTIASAKNIH